MEIYTKDLIDRLINIFAYEFAPLLGFVIIIAPILGFISGCVCRGYTNSKVAEKFERYCRGYVWCKDHHRKERITDLWTRYDSIGESYYITVYTDINHDMRIHNYPSIYRVSLRKDGKIASISRCEKEY